MIMRMHRSPARGFSLIEALVALVVMAFGMLGVLGIQSALRQYSDISKQRTEAVRLAQERIEDWRAFHQLGASAGPDYADIVSDGAYIDVPGANTTFQVRRLANALPGSPTDMPQRGKWVEVEVKWKDRSDAEQVVSFQTHVSGVSPELAGSLLVAPAGGPSRRPQGRHAGVPRQATDNHDGTSTFAPPGLSGVTWTFDNLTGLIQKICSPTCTSFRGLLLSGYVRYTDPAKAVPPDPPPAGPKQPAGADAELPVASSSTFGSVGVEVGQTIPFARVETCATETFPQYTAYYCAMEITLSTQYWSGRSYLTGLSLAADAADADAAKARVCRYTPSPSHTAANVDHPLDYVNVNVPLINQNFLVIRAGDGTTAFTCPGDDAATPLVNGNTYGHQPAT